jgi:hypothetical protein
VRISLGVVGLVALVAAPLVAQDTTHVFCRESACVVVFHWSNGSTPPDPDRRYGAPSELEAAFKARLSQAGYKIAASSLAPGRRWHPIQSRRGRIRSADSLIRAAVRFR